MCLGDNNGLELILDTESFDYSERTSQLGEDEVGFKLAITHPLDMPVIQQSGQWKLTIYDNFITLNNL